MHKHVCCAGTVGTPSAPGERDCGPQCLFELDPGLLAEEVSEHLQAAGRDAVDAGSGEADAGVRGFEWHLSLPDWIYALVAASPSVEGSTDMDAGHKGRHADAGTDACPVATSVNGEAAEQPADGLSHGSRLGKRGVHSQSHDKVPNTSGGLYGTASGRTPGEHLAALRSALRGPAAGDSSRNYCALWKQAAAAHGVKPLNVTVLNHLTRAASVL